MLFPAGSGLAVWARCPCVAGEHPACSCSFPREGLGSPALGTAAVGELGKLGGPKPALSSLFLPQPEGCCSKEGKIEPFLSSVTDISCGQRKLIFTGFSPWSLGFVIISFLVCFIEFLIPFKIGARGILGALSCDGFASKVKSHIRDVGQLAGGNELEIVDLSQQLSKHNGGKKLLCVLLACI